MWGLKAPSTPVRAQAFDHLSSRHTVPFLLRRFPRVWSRHLRGRISSLEGLNDPTFFAPTIPSADSNGQCRSYLSLEQFAIHAGNLDAFPWMVQAHLGIAFTLSAAGLVPRCEVRNLSALGRLFRACASDRMVPATDVSSGKRGV